jgi:outer membrane protein OmpA-like peptidoglycan-associated protein
MNAIHPSNRAVRLALLASLCLLPPLAAVNAQTGEVQGPLPPPAEAPESRLTVSPAEFEQWLAGLAPATEPTDMAEPEPAPSLVTPPPPPPMLVTPAPPAPTLVAPPAPPKIAPVPAAIPEPKPTTGEAPPAQTTPQPADPQLTAPPAPTLQPPEEPRIATLPPNSTVTTPPEPVLTPLVRLEELKIIFPAGARDIPETAKPDLDRLAAWLRENPTARLQVASYASGQESAGSQARMTSLYRARAVRQYLVENGVLSTRVSLCAFGANTAKLPRDRVEFLPLANRPALSCPELGEMREAQ